MTPEEHKREHKRLQELTHRNRMRLVDSELSLASTMSDLAESETELGDESRGITLLKKVSEAIQAVRRQLTDKLISDEERQEIEDRIQEITKRVDATKRQVFGGASATER